jgi:hypothetical protein
MFVTLIVAYPAPRDSSVWMDQVFCDHIDIKHIVAHPHIHEIINLYVVDWNEVCPIINLAPFVGCFDLTIKNIPTIAMIVNAAVIHDANTLRALSSYCSSAVICCVMLLVF